MKRFYALLLRLFPRAYREEYGEELKAVFVLSLGRALNLGESRHIRGRLRTTLQMKTIL